MKNILLLSKERWNEYELNLLILSDPVNDDQSIIEQIVSQKLDDYIENYSEHLMKLNIKTLYNIFNHQDRKITKNDLAYEFIQQHYFQNGDSSIFILLKFIDI